MSIFKLSILIAIIAAVGSIVGMATILFSPLVVLGMLTLGVMLLLWAWPESPRVPFRLLRKCFFSMIICQLIVPNYYAFQFGQLPWVSIRRLFILATVTLLGVVIAGSRSIRVALFEKLTSDRLMLFFTLSYLIAIFMSVFTAESVSKSFSTFTLELINYYLVFLACVCVLQTDEDIIFFLKLIVVSAMICSCAGVVEFILERRYYFDIIPNSILEKMLADNPALDKIIFSTTAIRGGLYRASSIFSVPLSFGEFEAIAAPIAAYFVLHGRSLGSRIFGCIAVLLCVSGLFVSGARGGFVSFLVAMPTMMFIWTIRCQRLFPSRFVAPIMMPVFFFGTIVVISLILFWPRAHNIVLGGGDTAASTNARLVQWDMAVPHILANPFTGHGVGNAAGLVGYYVPNTQLVTLDSYVITLLVDLGIPGFLFFAGIIATAIYRCLKYYLGRYGPVAEISGPIACSILAFGVYRLVLSQEENHTLFFMLIGTVFVMENLCRLNGARNLRKDQHK